MATDRRKLESGYQSLFQGGQFDDQLASALNASLAGCECISIILQNLMRT